MKTMQKHEYNRPSMRVVELKQHAPLICGSGGQQGKNATMNVEYYEQDI